MADYSKKRSDYLKVMYGETRNKLDSLSPSDASSLSSANFDAASLNAQQNIDQANQTLNPPKTDDRDWWQRAMDTFNAFNYNIAKGVLDFVDNISDFFINTFNPNEESKKAAINTNWQDAALWGFSRLGSPYNWATGDMFTSEYWDTANIDKMGQQYNESSYLNATGPDVTNFVRGMESSFGYMLPSIVAGAATGGTSFAAQAASLGTMGAGAFAGQFNEAYGESGDYWRSFASGLGSAAVEVGSELLVGKGLEKLGLGTGKIAGLFGDKAKKELSLQSQSFVKQLAQTMFEEGTEEVVSALADPFIKAIYKGTDALTNEQGKPLIIDKDFWFGKQDSVSTQFLSGAILGGILGGGNIYTKKKMFGDYDAVPELLNDIREKSRKPTESNMNDIAEDTLMLTALLNDASQNASPEIQKNLQKLLADPLAFEEEIKQDANNFLNEKLNQISKADTKQIVAKNLFDEMQFRYGTNLKLKFEDLGKENRGYIKDSTIVLNTKFADTYASTLAHEYLGHEIVEKGISTSLREKIFKDVVDTNWYKHYEKELRKLYTENNKTYKEMNAEQRKKYRQTEVINEYIEAASERKGFGKTTKFVRDVALRNTIWNRMAAVFSKKNSFKELYNTAVLPEFLAVAKSFAPTNVQNILDKISAKKKLTSQETAIVNNSGLVANLIKASKEIEEHPEKYSKVLSTDEDSKGRKLSKDQIKFNENNHFVDRFGNLLRLYHGSDSAGFMTFKDDKPIFLTPRRRNAASYTSNDNLVVTNTAFSRRGVLKLPDVNIIERFFNENEHIVPYHFYYTDELRPKIEKFLNDIKAKYKSEEEMWKTNMVDSMYYAQAERALKSKYILSFEDTIYDLGETYQIEDDDEMLFENAYSFYNNFLQELDLGENGKVYEVYAKSVNPLVIDCEGNRYYGVPYKGEYLTTDEIAERVKEEGKYDGIIFKNIVDNGPDDQWNNLGTSDVYVVFNANQIKAIDNIHPTEQDDIRYSKSLTPWETNQAQVVKDIANKIQGRIVNVNTAQEFYVLLEELLDNQFGIRWEFDKNKTNGRVLFEKYNLKPYETSFENVKHFIDDLFEQKIGDYKIKDLINESEDDLEFIKNDVATTIVGLLNEKGKISEESEYINKLIKNINVLYDRLNIATATNTYQRHIGTALKTIGKEFAKYGEKTTNILNTFFNKYQRTSKGFLSISNFNNFKSDVSNGLIKKVVDNFITSVTDDVSQFKNDNGIIDYDLIDDRFSILMAMSESLADSVSEGQVRPTAIQIETLDSINQLVKKLAKDYSTKELESVRNKAKDFAKYTDSVGELKKTNNDFMKGIQDKMFEASSPKTILSYMFGNSFSKEFEYVYEDLYKKPYEKQVAKYVEFMKERDKVTKYLAKHSFDNVKIGKLTIRRYALYQFYLNSLSPDNLERMKNNKLVYTDKTTHEFDFNEIEKVVKEQLTQKEINELKNLFYIYNSSLREYVKRVGINNLGFENTRDYYYPISSVDSRKITDFANAEQSMFKVNALSNNNLKALSSTKTSIELNNNPFDVFDKYVESMTITGEIGKASRELNRLFQLKVNDKGDTLLTSISKYTPYAKKYVSSMIKKLLANVGIFERKGFIDNLVGKSATAVLTANISTMGKQFGSMFTATRYTTVPALIKTLLSPTTIKEINKHKEWLKEHNAVFAKRIYENGAVRAATMSAGAKQFANSVARKIVEFGMKGMEYADRFTCYITFEMAYNRAKVLNPNASEEVLLEKANAMFTDILLDTQSNADRIAVSMVRSGEKGSVMKNTFGLFGSDNQNKWSTILTDINDIKDLSARIKKAKPEDLSVLNKNLKQAYRNLAVDSSNLLSSGVWAALIALITKWALDKEEPEDFKIGDFAIEIAGNTFIDWIPYFNSIANWLKFGEVEYFPIKNLDELVETVSSISKNGFTQKNLVELSKKVAQFFGFPAQNIENLITGTLGNINPALTIKYKNAIYGANENYLNNEISRNIKNGHIEKASSAIETKYFIYKTPISDITAKAIVQIMKDGYKVNVRNVPKTYKVDDQEITLTEKERQNFVNKYSQLGGELQKVATNNSLSSLEKATIINQLSSAYYEYSLGTKKTKLSKLVGKVDLTKYLIDAHKIKKIAKDKQSIIREINKLHINRNEKMLLALILGYGINKNNKESFSMFLRRLGFSKEEIEQLL